MLSLGLCPLPGPAPLRSIRSGHNMFHSKSKEDLNKTFRGLSRQLTAYAAQVKATLASSAPCGLDSARFGTASRTQSPKSTDESFPQSGLDILETAVEWKCRNSLPPHSHR